MIRNPSRRAVLAGVVAAAVFMPAPSHAASPQPTKFSVTDAFIDPDFCGTGEAVERTFSISGTQLLSPKNALIVETYRIKETFTFGDTTVIGHAAGRFTATTVSVAANGERTEAYTTKGLPESYRLQGGGGLLTRDAGTITFFVTFDADGDVIGESFTASGPHPQADSGFTLFCELIPEALGIE